MLITLERACLLRNLVNFYCLKLLGKNIDNFLNNIYQPESGKNNVSLCENVYKKKFYVNKGNLIFKTNYYLNF